MVTKREQRISKRKEILTGFAEKDQVYCIHYCRFLEVEDIEYHHCYSGNHGSRYCNYVDFPGGNREGKRIRENRKDYDEPEDR